MIFQLVLQIDPKPQPRPRFTIGGHAYEPTDAKRYKQDIARLVRAEMATRGVKQIEAGIPIQISALFCFAVPKSWSKIKRQAALSGFLKHTQRPDLDNLLKAVKDALNGVLWVDDSQVVSYGSIRKLWAETPSISICIRTDDAQENRN